MNSNAKTDKITQTVIKIIFTFLSNIFSVFLQMNLWLKSLKKFNEGKQMWCIPRKGTDMHDVVRNIINRRSVSLPLDEFTKEHARLISTLKNPTPEKLKEEAARQAKELAKELRGRRPPKKKVSVKVSL